MSNLQKFYHRLDLDASYGRLHIKVPRDRNGHFEQQLIPDYARRTDELKTTIITPYKKGITTREISDLIEKIYGHPYSPATMSNISKAVADQVENFHKRQLSERYAVIFMDATYLNVRRGVMLSNDSFRKQSISNAGFIFHVRLPDTFAIRIVKRSSVI